MCSGRLRRPGAPPRSSAPTSASPGFKWGTATAAYQIEGAVKEDGRGPTNWDVFSPHARKDLQRRHRRRRRRQLPPLRRGHAAPEEPRRQTYRMSLAWSRIFPEGRGKPNPKGVDHYKRVIDNLLENGIEPYVTMFHWDLPAALPGRLAEPRHGICLRRLRRIHGRPDLRPRQEHHDRQRDPLLHRSRPPGRNPRARPEAPPRG